MEHPKISRKTHIKVYLTLMVLMALNLVFNQAPLGKFNFPVTLAVAIAMAIVQVGFFMDVRHNPRVVWTYASMGFIWFTFLVGGTLMDILTR